MRAEAEQIEAWIRELESYIDLARRAEDAITQARDIDSQARNEPIQYGRQLAYRNVVIASYGLVEEAVDNITQAVASHYTAHARSLDDYPKPLLTAFSEMALQLVGSRPPRERTRTPRADLLDALAAIERNTFAVLPLGPLTASAANYRWEHVRKVLGRVHVVLPDRPPRNDVAAGHLDALGAADLAKLLQLLVERRNEMAHSFNPDDRLDLDSLAHFPPLVRSVLGECLRQSSRSAFEAACTGMPSVAVGTVAVGGRDFIGVNLVSGRLEVSRSVVFASPTRLVAGEIASLQEHGKNLRLAKARRDAIRNIGIRFAGQAPRVRRGTRVYAVSGPVASLISLTQESHDYFK